MSGLRAAAAALLRRLVRSRDGNIAMITGLAAIPLIVAAGAAVDATRAYIVKMQLGSALDAAVLAVGSTISNNNTTLTTQLQNYFNANFPASSLVSNVTLSTVPQNADLTQPTITARATAIVPMTFMQIVGMPNITVSVTSQAQKTQGLEVALVLDNTGSMLCGPQFSNCANGVITSDTSCSNPSNEARICELKWAAKQFVDTIFNAVTVSDQLYVSVVPYVTTVNVGASLCSGPRACSDIVTDTTTTTPIFKDRDGNLISLADTVAGTTSSGSATISSISPATTGILTGMTISGSGVSSCSNVTSVGASTVNISPSATSSKSNSQLTLGIRGNTTSGSAVVSAIASNTSVLQVGMVVTGSGIPANSAILSIDSTSQIHLTKAATSSQTGACLSLANPVSFDTTQTTNTTQWTGCVVEPTSSDEMTGASGVLVSGVTDPDFTDPGTWPAWYPLYWQSSAGNTWTATPNSVSYVAQLGNVNGGWTSGGGPNNGCPVPIVPLTTDKTKIENTINSMWPRDRGGTQVHVGMVWGWRTISPNTPFTGGSFYTPSAYHTAGWKKVVILETDGTEEWPDSNQYTGLGFIGDGKINTTSISTAPAKLDSRLQTICTNMKNQGIIIYTIALGTDGASNTTLLNVCPANGGFSMIATDSASLQAAFDAIAKALMALRLTQ